MKKEFCVQDAKFVFSKNELGYQEVLDDFPNAEEIIIVTFNISERRNQLVSALQRTSEECEISVITNIPNRWDMYYGDTFRNRARKTINVYMSKLNPEKLGSKASVFFDFNNHGKIIMTNSVIYIGSANFSEESANNTEFGFISRDADFLTYIKNSILPVIEEESTPYYEYDFTELLLEANMALSALYNIRNVLFESAYCLHDDFDGQWTYYNQNEAFLSHKLLEKIRGISEDAVEIASDIYDAIDVITESDDDELDCANTMYEAIRSMQRDIEDISESSTLYELASFSFDDYVDQHLEEDYGMEAYEENLEDCIEKVSGSASDIIYDLTTDAQQDVDDLLSKIDTLIQQYSDFIEKLKSFSIKKINPDIDNT